MAAEQQWDVKQHGAHAALYRHGGDYPYTAGAVLTPCGMVSVYYQPADERNKAYLRLDFIHAGRCYTKVQNKAFTERGIVTVAHRFAREVSA